MAFNQETLVTVFGGSGFLGRNVVRALAKRNYRIRVAVRRPELANFLQPPAQFRFRHAGILDFEWNLGSLVPPLQP